MTNRKIFILPYKSGSLSAKSLAQALHCKRLKTEGSRYIPRAHHIIVNWGTSSVPTSVQDGGCLLLNRGDAVSIASDKLHTFQKLSEQATIGINIPQWTVSRQEALTWIEQGSKVVARTLLRGHSGNGIVMVDSIDSLEEVTAPLYVKYIKKQQEYRVHVFNGSVIDVQRKMRRTDTPDDAVDWQVRNHSNGFIFGREGVSLPDTALAMCVDSVAALGLDFGAVDLIWNERADTYYVLEINTACGLTGTTLDKYVAAIRSYSYA
jgi:glutathione synthase/RimK-type ligase-like ATP-grasp enzyme